MKDAIELIKKYWIGLSLSIIFMICLNFAFGTVCMSKILMGVPCPACGITRASLFLLSGRFKEAYEMHPLVYLLILEVFLCIIVKKILNKYSIIINRNFTININDNNNILILYI